MYNLYLTNSYSCNKFYFELTNCFLLEFCSKLCLFNSEYTLLCSPLPLRRSPHACCGGVRSKGPTKLCLFVCISDSLPKLKVSHHPPLAGVFSEGRDWELYQEVAISSKFRGRYLQIIPQGNSFSVYSHGFIFLQSSPVIFSQTSISQTQGLEKNNEISKEGKIHEFFLSKIVTFNYLWYTSIQGNWVIIVGDIEVKLLQHLQFLSWLLRPLTVFAWFILHSMTVYQYCLLASLHKHIVDFLFS